MNVIGQVRPVIPELGARLRTALCDLNSGHRLL